MAGKYSTGKPNEFLAIAIAVAIRYRPFIAHHAAAAVMQSAPRAAVAETLSIAVCMGASLSAMYAG